MTAPRPADIAARPDTDHPGVLEMRGIHKSFEGVHALRGAELEVRGGEIHTLLGENGAGKSTLVKIIAGVHQPDAGSISWEGRPVEALDRATSEGLGIRIIYQKLTTIAHLSVRENLTLGREPRRFGIVSRQRERSIAREALATVGAEMDLEREAGSLSVAERQLLEIARALQSEPRLLVMDEPTASLGEQEVERLFDFMRSVRDRGVAIVFISHKLSEVMAISDRITVLRDGRTIGTLRPEETTPEDLVERMVGRDLSHGFHVERSAPTNEVLLEARDLWTDAGLRGVSLSLRRGEVLGVYGLMGSGRTELARALFGADQLISGEVRLEGRPVTPFDPTSAKRLGLGFVPEERGQAVFEGISVRENIASASGDLIARLGILRRSVERVLAQDIVAALGVRTPSIETRIGSLSGGNQQKAILGRWLVRDARVLILDDPTSGVDVGAKLEIYRLIADLGRRGTSTIMSSSELPELLAIADRILVLYQGRVAGVVDGSDLNQRAVLHLALRGSPATPDSSEPA